MATPPEMSWSRINKKSDVVFCFSSTRSHRCSSRSRPPNLEVARPGRGPRDVLDFTDPRPMWKRPSTSSFRQNRKIQNPDLRESGASGFLGSVGQFPFLFPSLVVKKTAETEFWDNFIVLHGGEVNQNEVDYTVLGLSCSVPPPLGVSSHP